MARLRTTSPGLGIDVLGRHARGDRRIPERRLRHDAGHVRVYAESGGTWTQVGADIDGEAAGDQSGYLGIDVLGRHARGDRRYRTTATATRRPRAGVRRERRDVDPGGRRHRRRGCGRPVRVLGIDVLGRHARGDRRYRTTRWQRRRPRAGVRRERRDVDPGGRRHRRRGCGRPVRVLGIDVLGRHARGDRRYRERRRGNRRPRAGVRRERRDVDPGGRRHRRRGCGRPVRVLGIDVLGRHARGDRRYRNDAPATSPATCGCTPRAAGRGPRWAPTSTARLRATSPGSRYRCPRTARAWR